MHALRARTQAVLREHDAASPAVTMLAWTLVATVSVLLAGFAGALHSFIHESSSSSPAAAYCVVAGCS
jgi:hypothetical protein